MKFLKTFLFTISLTFISFGIVTLKGFCASVALDPTISSTVNSNLNQFSSFAVTPEYLAIYGPAYLDELNTQLYQNYGWDLETLSWYGEDRFKAYMFGQEENPINGGQISSTTVNTIASRMQQGISQTVLTAQALYDTGYNYFCTSAPQWGNNAKQWILGKIDSVTGTISEVGSNTVTKITAEGLANYSSLFEQSTLNGDVQNITTKSAIKTDTFRSYGVLSQYGPQYSVLSCQINSSQPLIIYTRDYLSYNVYRLLVLSPVSNGSFRDGTYFDFNTGIVSGFYVDGYGTTHNIQKFSLYGIDVISINGESYVVGDVFLDDNYFPGMTYSFGDFSQASSLVNSDSSICLSYDYSSSWQSSLQGQLERLIGKYVDSIALKRIQDIVDSIPVGVENVGGVDVPVAIPTQSIVDDLTSAVDDAVALSPDYAVVFEDADAVVLDPDVPIPTPNNQGTSVPDDFSDTIFSPINDSVGSVFDFVSIFEPLFYIFSFSTGLLGLWFVVPFVILFLILFRLLK